MKLWHARQSGPLYTPGSLLQSSNPVSAADLSARPSRGLSQATRLLTVISLRRTQCPAKLRHNKFNCRTTSGDVFDAGVGDRCLPGINFPCQTVDFRVLVYTYAGRQTRVAREYYSLLPDDRITTNITKTTTTSSSPNKQTKKQTNKQTKLASTVRLY